MITSFAAPLLFVMGGVAPADASPPETPARMPRMPMIGDTAYDFEADTTHGPVTFPDAYVGKWVILFSHPGDFTPVCTSEFMKLSAEAEELEQLNTQLLGLSVDPVSEHRAWTNAIRDNLAAGGAEIPFPIIGDPDGEVAWQYGMIHPKTFSNRTVRAVFVIDPKSTIRAILYYPAEVGRSIAEVKRLVVALQTSDRHTVAMPADWQPGHDVLLPTGATRADASKALGQNPDASCKDWFFCSKKLPDTEKTLPKS